MSNYEDAGERGELEILREARSLIAEPHNWLHGESARDENFAEVSPIDPKACKFCATGAVLNACRSNNLGLITIGGCIATENIFTSIAGFVGCFQPDRNPELKVIQWNDHKETTHQEVLAAFDAAIANLEGET